MEDPGAEEAPDVSAIDPVDEARSRIGSTIDDKYQLIDLIGLGATGAVYKAQNRWAGRVCAVKLFHYHGSNEQDVLRRFVREAQAIHRVQKNGKLHPHVVDAIDVGRDAETGCFFVVQELLRGETLATYLSRIPDHRLSMANALRIFAPVLDAIACAHAGGVVHRDLKPENILLTRGGDTGIFPKVLDFGIAQIADERVTPVSDFLGTPQYMPPEAFGGATLHDARGDVWALATILYEMVSGTSPFAVEGDDPTETMERVQHHTPPSLAGLGVVAPTVWCVLRRALSKVPAQRYANAREFADALDAAQRPVRSVRVAPGMTLDLVRRLLLDPARHTVVSPARTLPPVAREAAEQDHSVDVIARRAFSDRRSMFPRASLTIPPVSSGTEPPAAPDTAFAGDPLAHWWSVHFMASSHTAEQVHDILSLPALTNLVELHVSNCPLGDSGVELLAESGLLRNVHALTLCRVGLSPRGVLTLARSPCLASLLKLDLEQNALGTDGLRTLLASRYLGNLRTLGLVLTGLGSDAGDALTESSKLQRLQRLDLSQNLLGDDGVAALCEFRRFHPEMQLVLSRNRVSPGVIERAQAVLSRRVRKVVL